MVKIKDEYITLQQLLKIEDIASSGGEAKVMIQDGMIKVNGETEVRRGRKLYPGDVVSAKGKTFKVE